MKLYLNLLNTLGGKVLQMFPIKYKIWMVYSTERIWLFVGLNASSVAFNFYIPNNHSKVISSDVQTTVREQLQPSHWRIATVIGEQLQPSHWRIATVIGEQLQPSHWRIATVIGEQLQPSHWRIAAVIGKQLQPSHWRIAAVIGEQLQPSHWGLQLS